MAVQPYRVADIVKDFDRVSYPSREQSYSGSVVVFDEPGDATSAKDASTNARVSSGKDYRTEDTTVTDIPATKKTSSGQRKLTHGRTDTTNHGRQVTNSGSDSDVKSGSDTQVRSGTDTRVSIHGDQTSTRSQTIVAAEASSQTQQAYVDTVTGSSSQDKADETTSTETRNGSDTTTRNIGQRRSTSTGLEDIGIGISMRIEIQNRQPILIE